MRPAIRRVLSVARTCKKAVRSCVRSVRKITILCSCLKRNKSDIQRDDEEAITVTLPEKQVDESQEAFDNQSNTSTTIVKVALVCREVNPPSANDTLTVSCGEEPKNTKKAKRVSEIPADLSSLTSPICTTSSTLQNEVAPGNSQDGKKEKKTRRKKAKKPRADLSSLAQKQSGKTVSDADESRRIKETPAGSSTKTPSTIAQSSVSQNEEGPCKNREAVVGKQSGDDIEVSARCRRTDENPRRKRADHSADVQRSKEQRTETNGRWKKITADKLNESGDSAVKKFSGVWRRGTPNRPAFAISNAAGEETAVRQKVTHAALRSNDEIKLDRAENAWVPRIATRKVAVTMSYAGAAKTHQPGTTEEVIRNANSMLNKIAPGNMVKLIESFKALPIDTIERLEDITGLVFEKAIREQNFAPLYAALCSAMQSVRVTCAKSNRTATFKALVLKKCQGVFDADKIRQTNAEEELKREEDETELRKRSVGNCRFIGELYKHGVVTTNIMLYCVTKLIDRRSEEPLESLCKLLVTAGKELERFCNLDETFDKLQALSSDKRIVTRIRFMIQDVIDLQRKGW